MTPAEKARRVAEIAKYEVREGRRPDGSVSHWTVWDGDRCLGSIHLPPALSGDYNPRHDYNQADEALNRVFPAWRHGTWTASDGVRYHLITGGKYSSQPETSFGDAAVAVILAAGGKK